MSQNGHIKIILAAKDCKIILAALGKGLETHRNAFVSIKRHLSAFLLFCDVARVPLMSFNVL